MIGWEEKYLSAIYTWLTCCIVVVSSITFFGKRKFAQVAAVGRKPAAITRELRSSISLAEVSQHNTENDVWLVVNGIVIDCTKFLDNHPAGKGMFD